MQFSFGRFEVHWHLNQYTLALEPIHMMRRRMMKSTFLLCIILLSLSSLSHTLSQPRLVPSSAKSINKRTIRFSTPLNDESDDGWDTSELDSLREQSQKKALDRLDEQKERDLFIPIFALVSLTGLFGSYAYELLRLYSRGELYLPWET